MTIPRDRRIGKYTGVDLLLRSELHYHVIQTRLTPCLNSVTKPMEDELAAAISFDFPECHDKWVAFRPYHVLLILVARKSARVFVGLPFCRDPKWLEISTQFTENSKNNAGYAYELIRTVQCIDNLSSRAIFVRPLRSLYVC